MFLGHGLVTPSSLVGTRSLLWLVLGFIFVQRICNILLTCLLLILFFSFSFFLFATVTHLVLNNLYLDRIQRARSFHDRSFLSFVIVDALRLLNHPSRQRLHAYMCISVREYGGVLYLGCVTGI